MAGKIRALALTVGDVNGIGPEVVLKAALGECWPSDLKLIILGERRVISRACSKLSLPEPPDWCNESRRVLPPVSLWDFTAPRRLTQKDGVVSAVAAHAALGWIRAATMYCLTGRFDGMVTGPISKEAFGRAGIKSAGHTELLGLLTNTKKFAMMLMGGGLRVVCVTRHIPLLSVPAALSSRAIVEAGELACQSLGWLGVKGSKTVAVCGLNPHAGDGGALGSEERRIIAPAVRRLARMGLKVEGPVPADVVFYRALKKEYGCVLAMYHDQGLGPLKMVGFEKGVNITLGLPIIRTSPDHGTAFDIAGKWCADPSSMIAAIELGAALCRKRNPWKRK